MRDIKCRARNAKLPPCWIYGYFVIENGTCFIINRDGRFMVIAGTESQYIGLKDLKGRQIFEGDIIEANIIEFHIPTRGVIVFDQEHMTYANKNMGGLTFLFKLNEIKIIGNIHSNPELLEQK